MDSSSSRHGPSALHAERPDDLDERLRAERADRLRMRIGVAVAVTAHAVAFAIQWPTLAAEAQTAPPPPEVRVVRLYQFTQPPPPPPDIEIPRPARVVQIPDSDPENDEPFRHEEPLPVEMFEVDTQVLEASVPPPPPPEEIPDIIEVGGAVSEPRVVHRVVPEYTQAALRTGIQGAVILELVIDPSGRVTEATVLKGLPLGLTDQALEAVRQWVFEPSTFRGHPVSVRYRLTVVFTINRG